MWSAWPALNCCTPTPDRRDWRRWLQRTGLASRVAIKGGQVFDTLELGMIAAARGYGVSMGDLLMVAEDVAQGALEPALAYCGGQRRKLLPGLAQDPPRRRAPAQALGLPAK
jgi:DNA-binding transcriptional LysR family regulator